MEDLARRAVACKGWRWMPGMRQLVSANFAPYRVVSLDWSPPEGDTLMETYGNVSMLPDLDDPATLGCLLALVREAYSMRLWLAASRDGDMWYVDAASGALAHGNTEGEALVAALEAAND